MASPKVLERNRIFLPSCDQSARSPNQVTWVMYGGKWSAGFSPGVGLAAMAGRAAEITRNRMGFLGFIKIVFSASSTTHISLTPGLKPGVNVSHEHTLATPTPALPAVFDSWLRDPRGRRSPRRHIDNGNRSPAARLP